MVKLHTGFYFARWLTHGRFRSVRTLKRSRLFLSAKEAAATISKLKRAGNAVELLSVDIVIGGRR